MPVITPQTVGWAIVALALGGAGGAWFGYDSGHASGVLEEQARRDSARVRELATVLTAIRDERLQTTKDNAAMRSAIAGILKQDQDSTKELKNALTKSKSDPVVCRFDADSMRLLFAAADDADRRAAGGIRGPVPSSGASNR
jgi:uncharacterized membrane protein